MDARRGYIGLEQRDRWASAGAVAIVFTALLLALMLLARGPEAVPPKPEATVRTFDVPLPPVPKPPPPVSTPRPEPKAAPAAATARSLAVGGSRGRARERSAQVAIDHEPPVAAAFSSPLVVTNAAPPPAGQSVGLASGGAGASGDGQGVGSGTGNGAGTGDGAARYARTEWIVPPTRKDFEREWPRRAPRLSTVVDVLLACRVTRQGYLRNCAVLRDGQPGQGYGDAAIRMARYSRARPVRKNGRAVDMPVLVPFAFQPTVRPDAPPAKVSRPRPAP